MEKTYNYSNCTVRVHIPEIKNNERIRKASEKFMRQVLKERGESDER